MKALKFLGSTVLLCLFVVACAKSNKEEQARIAGPDATTTAQTTDAEKAATTDSRARVAKEGYTSTNVILTKDSGDASKSTGTIQIFEEDARRLYERLKIVPTTPDANELATATKTKQGKNLACSEFVRGDNKVYSCIIAINYKTGKLASTDKEINVDKDAKASTEAYGSEKTRLSIIQGAEGNGILSVFEADAKVLYEVSTVEEGSLVADGWLSSKEKIGANLRCYKHSNPKSDAAPSYTCSVSINVNDGTVKASDVKAAAAPKDDTKSTDETPAADPATADPAPADAPAAPAPAPADDSKLGV